MLFAFLNLKFSYVGYAVFADNVVTHALQFTLPSTFP